jgi:uncharacterized protein YyaL (SSP411 family)
MPPHTNRLSKESSPYLLQHAHNPVDWYPWSEEAFLKAKKEDKPVLVSIGYAACHWCHVMERESFEDPDVAAIMNENFVNIKVDREERPDVDGIYMDAVQAIAGSGGWPLNVFLTPEGKPFYGGTYFPPRRAYNRASWREVLTSIAEAYKQKKDEIENQAEVLTDHLRNSNALDQISNAASDYNEQNVKDAIQNALKQADKEWGGFGGAPKFPQTFTIINLLRYSFLTGDKEARDQALLSLDKMSQGGIYDHIGGGFARYSTDTEWLAPHFEKMLYDNALLISALSEAYQLTGEEKYKKTVTETLDFIERELMHPDGGFYSSLDADSEGVEGKFYVWDYEEVKEILGVNSDLFIKFYDISPHGNWELKNIPRVKIPLELFAQNNNISKVALNQLLEESKKKLFERRSSRIRPMLDDKMLLEWNALMNKAYSYAYAATGNEHYKEVAVNNMNFLLKNFIKDDLLYHNYKEGKTTINGFLDDYAYLISALIELQTITADTAWLIKAKELTSKLFTYFRDDNSPFFFYTPEFQKDILLRKKEIYDGATPSGNAVMALNLHHLSILFDQRDWADQSEKMIKGLLEMSVKYPTSFGVWLSVLMEKVYSTNEIAVVGKDAFKKLKALLHVYIPHKVVMSTKSENQEFPLLAQKNSYEQTRFFLCKNYECLQPVDTLKELQTLAGQNN